VRIETEHDFSRWAKTIPLHLRKRASAAVAIRAADRVLPLLAHELRLSDEPDQKILAARNHVLPTFAYLLRAYSSEHNEERYHHYSHYRFASPYSSDTAKTTFRITWSAQAAAEASSFTDKAYVSSVRSASAAIERSVSAARSIRGNIAAEAMRQVESDVSFIIDSPFLIESLLSSELWTRSEGRVAFHKFWNELRGYLLDIDPSWSVWVEWYDGKLRGYVPFSVDFDTHKRIMSDISGFRDAEWSGGPDVVNHLAADIVIGFGGKLPAVYIDHDDETILDQIPTQGVGPHFEVSDDYIIDRMSADRSRVGNGFSDRTAKLCPIVLQSAKDLSSRLSGNQFRELSEAIIKYILLLDKSNLSEISWSEVWGVGVIIRNIFEASQRDIGDRMLPELEDPAKAALDSLLTLHGPLILSTREGQELADQSQLFDKTRAERALLRDAAKDIAAAISLRTDIATKSAAEAVVDAASAMAEGSHPERGAVYGLASVRNVMIPLVAAAVVTSPSTIGYLAMGPTGVLAAAPVSLVAVEGLKKSPRFMAFVSALGSRFDDVIEKDPIAWLGSNAKKFAPFRSFFIENKENLLNIAAHTPELKWIEKYIRMIESDDDL
jgi:hypothetical protein